MQDVTTPPLPPLIPGRYPVLSNRSIAWAAIVLIVVGVGLAIMLLVDFGDGTHPDQLDAIKTAGTIVVGTGGAAALWLTARRQQATEIALNQAKEAHVLQEQVATYARAHQDRVAATTEGDAQARRITDLYTKAADQIGSDKAPVRLAGLYALRRVAQDNPDQRQTIVDVISAYLRMPYTLPAGQPPAEDASDAEHARFAARTQERQVRLTAQRILATHLCPGDAYWPDIDLDLTDATLIDLDFSGCRLGSARFDGAVFVGAARFDGARFLGAVRFDGARFTSDAGFAETRFEANARFDGTVFSGDADFVAAEFISESSADGARFVGARFAGMARFSRARFTVNAWFDKTRFEEDVRFSRAVFATGAAFQWARFGAGAAFSKAEFAGVILFDRATFGGVAEFNEARFTDDVGFTWTEFGDAALFDGAVFARAPRFDQAVASTAGAPSSWPREWTVVPDAERAGWGRLARESG
jgi:uncharacterized protein YjbI with pentapeptide repeats